MNILILLTSIIITLYILFRVISLIVVPTSSVIVENGFITSETSANGYVIRDEQIAKGENTENGIYQIKTEGEKVAKGEPIFRYYTSNEETLNNKIQEAMLRTNRYVSS